VGDHFKEDKIDGMGRGSMHT